MRIRFARLGTLTTLLGVVSLGVFAPAASADTPTNVALHALATATDGLLPALPCTLGSGPEKAVDGAASNIYTDKWCVPSGRPTLHIALPANSHGWTVSKIVIKHAGVAGENPVYNTRAYTLSAWSYGQHTIVATVSLNTANQTVHDVFLTSQTAVDLTIDTPTQGTNQATRIYEVEVWASPTPQPAGSPGYGGCGICFAPA